MKRQWTITDGPVDPSLISQGGSVVFSITDEAGHAGSLEIHNFSTHRHRWLSHHWNIVGHIIIDGETHSIVGTYKANHKHRHGIIYQI